MKKTRKVSLKSSKWNCLIFIIYCILIHQAYALNTQQFRIEHLKESDGLTGNSSAFEGGNVLQDNNGFMWFATVNGLNRFDGYQILTFQKSSDKKESLENNYVYSLVQDNQGDIWMASVTGIVRLNVERGAFTSYKILKKLVIKGQRKFIPLSINKMIVHQNTLLLATDFGLTEVDTKTGQHSSFIVPDNLDLKNELFRINDITIDKRGRIWLGTENGLWEYDSVSKNLVVKELSGQDVTSIFVDSKDRVLMSVGQNLYHYNSFTSRLVKVEVKSLKNAMIGLVRENHLGQWLIELKDKGICIFDVVTHRCQLLSHKQSDPESLSSNTITSMYKDNIERFWVTTNNGINVINPNQFHFSFHVIKQPAHSFENNQQFKNDDYSNFPTMAFSEGDNQNLYIGSFGGGVTQLDKQLTILRHFTLNSPSKSFEAKRVISLLNDRRGGILVGTRGAGLFRIDQSTFKIEHIKNSPDFINNMSFDFKGRIWLATSEKGLIRWHRSENKFRQLN